MKTEEEILIQKEYKRKYYLLNKEKIKKKTSDYYYNNKEKVILCNKKWNDNNKEKVLNYKKEYQENNKEIIKNNKNLYYIENKEYINNKCALYYINNKEHLTNYSKIYYLNNKEKVDIRIKNWVLNNKDKVRETKRIWMSVKRKNTLERLKNNIRSSVKRIFNGSKSKKTEEIIGCNYIEFILIIESKFEEWMTWDNYGLYNGELNYGWDLDHIIPLSSVKTIDKLLELSHHTNFQPLCSYTNRYIKKDRLDYE